MVLRFGNVYFNQLLFYHFISLAASAAAVVSDSNVN